MLVSGQHIHIVGVGGFGMSAIARVLLQQGYTVSGSDLRANDLTRTLIEAGAAISQGHDAAQIAGADLLAISSAVPDDNPEVAAARAAGIPVLRRRDLLGELMAQRTGIAIAGTHGKTTTTALLAHTLIEAGRDPTYIIGGVLQNTGDNAGVGAGEAFVIEADEYDHMFLGLRPQIAVITNIEHDHPDCFPTLADTLDAFAQFADRLPHDGLLVVCADDPAAFDLGRRRWREGGPVVTYALDDQAAEWVATGVEPDPAGGMAFTVRHGGASGEIRGRARLELPGRHNVLNALAVIAVADHLGVPFDATAAALGSFRGTQRRSEVLGQADGVTVISDYAHHPTAIRLSLAAYREQPGLRHLWAVWQPHTFGRMRLLADEFAYAFGSADHLLVTDVYSVREQVSPGLDAPGVVEHIRATGHADARFTGDFDATTAILAGGVQPGDWVVILSAGDAPQIGRALLDRLG
jgi:UDP-N-acetylmuramate--alanine ligase